MKKLLSALLALAMVLSLVPMAATAIDGCPVTILYVGGVNALEHPVGDGWSFDAATSVLTLTNCTITQNSVHRDNCAVDALIYFEGDLTIELVGENFVEYAIEEAPSVNTIYSAIYAGHYISGDLMASSKLSIRGCGSLTAGIVLSESVMDYWEFLLTSYGIYCDTEGGVDLTGLTDGGYVDVYGGVRGEMLGPFDFEAYALAWKSAPTFGDDAVVAVFRDVAGSIEPNYDPSNMICRMVVTTAGAYMNGGGLLTLHDERSTSGKGWSWENRVLTLWPNTEVMAVEFKADLDGAKLNLAGDVTLDTASSPGGSLYPSIKAHCDLEIDAEGYTLTLCSEREAIRTDLGDLLISDGTIEAESYYSEAIDVAGANLTIRNATFRSEYNEICTSSGYDDDDNTIPGGDIVFENAVVEIGSYLTANQTLTVTGSTVSVPWGGITGYGGITLLDSTVNVTAYGSALYSNGMVIIDNCTLDIAGTEYAICVEGYSEEPDTSMLVLRNMTVENLPEWSVDAFRDGGAYFYVTISGDGVYAATALKTTAVNQVLKPTISQKGANLNYEDLIYVIDIFNVQNADEIDFTTDAGMLIWSAEEYAALNGKMVFDAAHAIVGLQPYKDTGYFFAMSDGIYTRDMHKEAYYVGYVKLADGSYIYSEPKLYSPAIYTYNMLDKDTTSAATKELCVALLNYISAAQMYFDKTTPAENLVNADLSDEQKALNWENISFNLAPEVPADKQVDRDEAVFTKTGKNLLFEEMISIVSLYMIDDEIVSNAVDCGTIYWTAEQFAALEGAPSIDNIGAGTKTGMSVYRGNAGQWYSHAPEVAAKDMADTQYYYLGYVVHADGTVSYSGVQSYTVEQYISNTVAKESTSNEMRSLAQWLYYYERAAENAIA